MVKILANGEIVQDNDARLTKSNKSKKGHINQVQHDPDEDEQHGDGEGNEGEGEQSIFSSLNQKLLDAGIPAWNLGEHVIEPIVTVGFLVAFIVLGWRGIMFGVLLFVANKLSQRRGGISGLFQSFMGRGNNRRRPRRGGNRPPVGRNDPSPNTGPQRLGGQRLGGQKLGSLNTNKK